MKRILLFIMTFFSIFGYAQFPEGFEGATFSPTGWVVEDNGVGTGQSWGRTNATGFGWVHQGTWSAIVNRDNGATSPGLAQDWLITPQVTVPANGQIRFYSRSAANGEQGSVYKVLLSTTGQNRASFTTVLATYTELEIQNLPFVQFSIPLNAYAGTPVYFAFVMEVNNGLGDRWILDDVKVDQQCLVPTALTVTPFSTSANISWTSPNPAGPWEIEYGPQGFVPGTGTIVNNVTTNSHTITNLLPLTSYAYYVRTICDADNVSPWSIVRNFTTTVAPPECGGNFVDNGGVTGNYTNNADYIVTICPTNPGDLVTINFTSFITEAQYDKLYIYDGNSTAAPLISSGNAGGFGPVVLPGGFWGDLTANLPGPFTATNPTGCLTFRFVSDGGGVRQGWTSNITCAPPPDYCAGDHFYDIGGPTGNYPNNISSTRGYTKICPTPGQSATVFFNSFNVANDSFSIYDGDDLATALLVGTYTGTAIIPSYTASNPAGNGCLIFVFTSGASTNAPGWDATIVCGPPCQAINSSIASSTPTPGADTVIRVCQNQTFTLDGTATFGNSGTGAIYNWDFGDGNVGTGQSVTHSYSSPGIYSIGMYVVDNLGCRSVNRINQLVYVSTTPDFTGTLAVNTEICLGQSTNIIGAVTPVTYNRECAPPVSGTTFLPDGNGVSYQTSIPVDCFALGSTLTSVNQITSVCLNMEHSFAGDLQLQLVSPSGQSIILKAYPGGGGTYLGCPLDDPATGPGVGRDYCFTPVATTLLVNGATSNCGTPSNASFNAGNYQPVQSFTNLLGSTLNGNWTLVVTDNLGIDNGYIFNWGINFDSSLLPTDYQFTPVINNVAWTPDPSITNINGNQITVTPTTIGPHCYTYNVTDDFGCTYSQQVCIDVIPGVDFTDVVVSPTQICDGENAVYTFTGTPNTIVTYNINGGPDQTITLDGLGTATLSLSGLNITTNINVTYITVPPIPTTGNAISAVGGVNPNNSTGAILAAGTAANTANSTTINASNNSVTLTLANIVPAGTPITVSLAKNNTTGAVNIVDGSSTLLFNTGALNTLQHVTFIKGTTSNLLTVTRANGTVFLDGVSYTYDELGCDRNLNDSATVVVYAAPIVSVTPATCVADGSAIVTNYNSSFNYIFTPAGPSIDATGNIINAVYGTSYTIALDNVTCATGAPVTFVVDEMLLNLATPLISSTPPTCLADGFSTITNYDATATYTFNPAGPSVDVTGLITGMVLGTNYTVVASNTTCASLASAQFSNLPILVTPVVPTVSITAPTCIADGFATITNYDAAITYVFTPAGPSVDATGLISGMLFATNYEVAAFNGSCTSANSAIFTIDPILVTPAVPTIDVTAPTCLADGFSTISNYDGTLTYVFTPAGPSVDATGLISGMTLNTLYEVTASNTTCTSVASVQFSNLPVLVTPVVPTVSITAPTCIADGFATITNYDATITYVFTPAGPSVDATGLISGMLFATNYEVAAFNGSCTSVNSAIFTISQRLPQPTIFNITNNGPICVGSTATFTINATPNSQVDYSVDGSPVQTVAINSSGVGVVNVAGVTGSATINTISVFDGVCSSNIVLNSTVSLFADTTISLVSPATTENQTRCAGVTIDPIQYQVIGTATGVAVTGLPIGVTHNYNATTGLLTISGSVNNGGVYNYSIITTGGCNPQASASGSITITPRPTLSYTVTNTVCDGNPLDFVLSSNLPNTTYSWSATVSNISGSYSTLTNGDETNINQIATLTNPETIGTITMIIIPRANGCDGIPSNPITITVNPNPVIESVTVADSSVCSATNSTNNVHVDIVGNISGITYTWTAITNGVNVVGGVTSGTITATSTTAALDLQVITSNPLVAGTIYFEVSSVRNGCPGNTLQSGVVTVNPNPGLPISSPIKTICSGNNSDLIVDVSPLIAGTELTWEVLTVFNVSGANPGTGIAPVTINDVLTATTNTQGYVIYRVRSSLGECQGGYTDYRVNVNPAPLPKLVDGNICVTAAGEVYQTYTLNTGLNDADYDFEWFDTNGNTIPGATSSTLVVDEAGTYSVIATNWLTGCSSDPLLASATATVTETLPATSMTVVQSEYFSDNATITVTVPDGTGTLMYSLDEGPLQSSNVFTGVSAGEHLVTVIDTEGCTFMTQTVTIIDYPNYFTPNGDGINDTWNISGLNQADAKLYIFDRYGKLIKQLSATDDSEGWDGTYNQELLPSTDYWFSLDYTENGVAKQFKAHFTMKR